MSYDDNSLKPIRTKPLPDFDMVGVDKVTDKQLKIEMHILDCLNNISVTLL